MPPSLVYILMALILIVPLADAKNLDWFCRPCANQAECDRDPAEICRWGEVRNPCNRRECAKGPGEPCGGPLQYRGQCGEGLMCRSDDDTCHGCYIFTLDCA